MNAPFLIKNIDPITVNADGSLHGTVDKEVTDQSMIQFIEKANTYYNLTPIFQRDDVWSMEMKGRLINSIFLKIPIGPITLCENKNNIAYKNVIDAKQRCLALLAWWNGKFSIPVQINGIVKNLTWSQIRDSVDPILFNMRQTFESYKVIEVVYKNMSLPRQAKQFEIINTFIPPQNEELLYGYNYWAKALYQYILKNALKKVICHTSSKQERENKHEKGTIYAHRISYICFGGKLNDVWQIRALGNSKKNDGKKSRTPLVKETEEMNKFLAEVLEQQNIEHIDDKFVESLPFYDNLDKLKKLCDTLYDILQCKNPTRKRLKKNDLFDCIIFFMQYILDGTLTIAMMKNDKAKFLDIVFQYIEKKESRENMTGQSVTVKKIKERCKLFEEVYKQHVVDTGYKNQPIPPVHRTLALLKAESTCPITNEVLTDENVRIDHVDPKSINSETKYVAVSETGNLWKSNRTKEEIELLDEYLKNNG